MVVASPWASRAATAPSSTAEFDVPYQLNVRSGSGVIELSGSFSWAVPQSLQAALAAQPDLRIIRLESPGGLVQAALQVATIIRERGLDTYVGRLCASACTIAFLGGRQRWLGPNARLGFHQGRGPGLPPEMANAYLRMAYDNFAMPPQFIARVLRTPANELWFPTADELLSVHYTTGAAPAAMTRVNAAEVPRLSELLPQLRLGTDELVVEFAAALSNVLERLQAISPDACWSFVHEGPVNPSDALPPSLFEPLTSVGKRLVAASHRDAPSGETRDSGTPNVLPAEMRVNSRSSSFDALESSVPRGARCPALRDLLQSALARQQSAATLRSLLGAD